MITLSWYYDNMLSYFFSPENFTHSKFRSISWKFFTQNKNLSFPLGQKRKDATTSAGVLSHLKPRVLANTLGLDYIET
jgi:hypothetical protein